MGKFKTYMGGSYAVSIGPNKKIAKKVIESMKENFWVDRYVVVSFSLRIALIKVNTLINIRGIF